MLSPIVSFTEREELKEIFRRVSPVDFDQLIITHLRNEEEDSKHLVAEILLRVEYLILLPNRYDATIDNLKEPRRITT